MEVINLNELDGENRTNPWAVRDTDGRILWGLHFFTEEQAQDWVDRQPDEAELPQ